MDVRRSSAISRASPTASNGIMQKQRERKALIVLSDGVDTGSEATLDAASKPPSVRIR